MHLWCLCRSGGTDSACLSAPEAVAKQALTNSFRTSSAPGVANSVHLSTECTWMSSYVIICHHECTTRSFSFIPPSTSPNQIGIRLDSDWYICFQSSANDSADRTLHWHGWSANSSSLEGSTPYQHSLKQALKWRAEQPRDIQFLAYYWPRADWTLLINTLVILRDMGRRVKRMPSHHANLSDETCQIASL